MAGSAGEDTLARMLDADGMPYVREHRFHPVRKWRFDFVVFPPGATVPTDKSRWPSVAVAVEVEGVTPAGGRHQRLVGFMGDLQKYNASALLGWRLLRFTTAMVRDGMASETIHEFFGMGD